MEWQLAGTRGLPKPSLPQDSLRSATWSKKATRGASSENGLDPHLASESLKSKTVRSYRTGRDHSRVMEKQLAGTRRLPKSNLPQDSMCRATWSKKVTREANNKKRFPFVCAI